MPSKSPAQVLLEKADKKANSSSGWFSSATTKYEEAGDLYQQAANSFKIDKLFKEAGDAFAREAECREQCKELNEAANAWWNAAKAYKRTSPERMMSWSVASAVDTDTSSSRYSSSFPDDRRSDTDRPFSTGSRPGERDCSDPSSGYARFPQGMREF